MPYGNGQRLGETIDPRLMQVDFGAIERAGATQGNMFANLGQDIGTGMKQYGDTEKEIKKAEQMAKSIREAIPDLAPMADEALANLNNPDLNQRDRHAIAQAIGESLKIGVLGIENKRADALMGMDQDKFNWQRDMAERELAMSMDMARNTPMKPPTVEEFGVDGGTQKMVWNGYSGQWEPPKTAMDQGQIAPPDGVMPQGNPMGADPQARSYAPMRQQGDDMVANDIAEMAAMTPQVGESPDYGSFQEAMNMGGGVLPDKGWRDQPQPARIGFKPSEQKEGDKPQEVKLPDGSMGYGTFKNNVFKPALGPDGKPLVIPKSIDPKIAIDIAKSQSEAATKELSEISKAEGFLNLLDEFEKHPGFTDIYSAGMPSWVPFSDAKGAKAIHDQITAQSFLQGIKEMKGFGTLTEKEGDKVQSAFTKLTNTGIKDAEAKAEILKLKDVINKTITLSKENIQRLNNQSEGGFRTEPPSNREANSARLKGLITPIQ